MTADTFNGLFEIGGALLTGLSVRRLLIDKMVRGVSWAPAAFFAAWGLWNLYFYPSLGQWVSFAGGVALVCVNTANIVLLLKYRAAV